MPRTTRSSVSSDGDIHASTTALNPQVGRSGEGSESQVSSEGGSAPQGVKGNGLQRFRTSGKYYFPQDLPKFEGDQSAWDKFCSELVYMMLEMTGVNLLLPEKPAIDSGTNEFIFQCLSKCVNSTLYDIICRYKGSGFEAFKFLDKTIGGSIAYRQTKVVTEQANLTYFDNEDVLSYTSRFSRLVKDGVKYGMGEQPNQNGTFPILITRSLLNLPKRFTIWARGKLSLWQERGGVGYPTVEEYIDLLDQDRIIQRSEASYSSRGATNVSNIALNRKDNKRMSKNQLKKLKLRLKQASVSDGVGNQQVQNHIHGQTTAVNATALRQNKTTQGRPASKDHWKQNKSLTATATTQGQGQGYGRPFNRAPNLTQVQAAGSQNSSSKGGRPPITCKRCLSRTGQHTSDNCPSTRFCEFCNNWSHLYEECRKWNKN